MSEHLGDHQFAGEACAVDGFEAAVFPIHTIMNLAGKLRFSRARGTGYQNRIGGCA